MMSSPPESHITIGGIRLDPSREVYRLRLCSTVGRRGGVCTAVQYLKETWASTLRNCSMDQRCIPPTLPNQQYPRRTEATRDQESDNPKPSFRRLFLRLYRILGLSVPARLNLLLLAKSARTCWWNDNPRTWVGQGSCTSLRSAAPLGGSQHRTIFKAKFRPSSRKSHGKLGDLHSDSQNCRRTSAKVQAIINNSVRK
jgi:hypothetical protein